MENNTKYYDTFCGHKVSDYALKYGRLDYGTLAKCFDCVLCNNIPQVDSGIFDNIESGDFESFYYDGEEITFDEYDEKLDQINEQLDDLYLDGVEEDDERVQKLIEEKEKYTREENEIFQYYIVSDIQLLKECNELVFYSDVLDCYIWGVTHWGTSWDYVLTSLKLREKEND